MHKPLFSLPCLSVCLSVCVSVSNTTQNVMNGLRWKIMEGSRVVTWWFDFGSDRNHHAACPIGNLAISEQIMSGFWWHFHYSPALIYLSIDWICELMWITKLTLQLGYMGKIRILSCLSWGLRSWSALVSECTMKQVCFTILDKFFFVITWTRNSYHVVNYFHWPWLVTVEGNRNKCVK